MKTFRENSIGSEDFALGTRSACHVNTTCAELKRRVKNRPFCEGSEVTSQRLIYLIQTKMVGILLPCNTAHQSTKVQEHMKEDTRVQSVCKCWIQEVSKDSLLTPSLRSRWTESQKIIFPKNCL